MPRVKIQPLSIDPPYKGPQASPLIVEFKSPCSKKPSSNDNFLSIEGVPWMSPCARGIRYEQFHVLNLQIVLYPIELGRASIQAGGQGSNLMEILYSLEILKVFERFSKFSVFMTA